MTLQVRNFNCWLAALLFSAALLPLSGCKKDEPENIVPAEQPAETLSADLPRPSWKVSEAGDMTLSMTAVVKVDLAAQYPELAAGFAVNDEDLMAAFIGETCLEVRAPQEGLFLLYINSPESGDAAPVTLRYYSAHYKNLFIAADAFPFANGSHPGTVAEPVIPAFVVAR